MKPSKCPDPSCACHSAEPGAGWLRRDFLKLLGLGAGALALPELEAMAGPFTRQDFEKLVPADKKLRPEWIASLMARGQRTVYRGADLERIGMPIGGIYAGQLYLGGDGKLWHWDIFNRSAGTGAEHYAKPVRPASPFEHGFVLRLTTGGQTRQWPLEGAHWRDISFIGEYPIGYVEYRDADCPAAVSLEAFSPFIPLNTDDSSLPATVLEYTVKNQGNTEMEVEVTGWLETPVCLFSSQTRDGLHRNRLVQAGQWPPLQSGRSAPQSGAGQTSSAPPFLFLECGALEAPAPSVAPRPDIAHSDPPRQPLGPLAQEPDFGTLGLALLDREAADFGSTEVPPPSQAGLQDPEPAARNAATAPALKPFGQKLAGSLTRKRKLAPGASAKATFVLAWHMPNLKLNRLPPGRYYATRFDSALAVARYVRDHFTRLSSQTRLWHDTWYDSTLPYWFLDRTFLNASILATSTCHRFADGRFYGWEGVGCCEGTCGHVWQYAHAMARLFPDLERITREKVDFGLALQPDGAIHFRGEFNNFPAIDAQAGAVLRALREHQVSADDAFLKRNWPSIKKAAQWLIAKDGNGDGLIESNQHNTLDTDWFGPVAWLSGLYLAALLAAETLALEMDDQDFAARCRTILEAGQKNIVAQLFEGEYFINKPDPKRLEAINSGTGCEIDQVFGQSWAFQVGLPRVFPAKETLSALKSLWRYNFTPDVGPYRAAYKPGRWYAMPGEAGLLMCTFPRSDWDYTQAKGKGPDWAAGYFNECMNGFEYQAAGHMIWEGLLTEGLAVTRAVHDRYHASRRNPWNEVECGDHYARSMASYGIFLAACGFECHGPKGRLGFAPRLAPEDFRAAFTTAEGWGTYSQKFQMSPLRTPVSAQSELSLKWGSLRLRTLTLDMPEQFQPATVSVELDGRPVPSKHSLSNTRLTLTLSDTLRLAANQQLTIRLA